MFKSKALLSVGVDDKDTIKEQDFNESHYWHTIMDVVQLMRKHGYLSVMENINSVLHNIKDISYK